MSKTAIFNNYISEAAKTLKEQGLAIRWGTDFHLFRRIITKHKERYEPAPGFHPECSGTDDIDGIWLVAYRGSNELVHTQACRRVSILPNMHRHLVREANVYEPAYLKFDLDSLEVNLSPDASQIKGDAIYHGEAWLKGGPNGIRGGSALCIFSRMMIAKTLLHWDVKYIYGLISPTIGLKGLAQRYGYTRCEQGAITFLDRPVAPNDLWFVWMTAAEAQSQLRLKPGYFAEMLEPSDDNVVGKVA